MAGTPLATAFVRLRADGSQLARDVVAETGKAGPAADKAGAKVGRKIVDGASPEVKALSATLAKEVGRAGVGASGSARKAGERVGEKLNDGVKDQLGGLKATVGGVIAGLGVGEAVSGLFERENVGGKIAAQFGSRQAKATAAEAGRAAAEVYAQNFGDNLDQVGEAIVAINRNIPGIGDELATTDPAFEHLTKQALTLVSLFGQDLPEVTRTAGQLIRTGLVKNAGQAFDLITAGFQQGLDSGGDLLDTLNEYPTQFRKLGLSGSDALGLLRQGLQGGARDSDIVADAIKEFSIRAVDGTTTTAAAFKALRLPVKDTIEAIAKGGPTAREAFGVVLDRLKAVKDPAKQAQLAVALFGTQAEDLGRALFNLNLGTASRQMGDFKGATDRAGDAISNTAGAKLETFRRGLQTKVVDFLGNSVIPKLQATGEFIQRNSDLLLPLAAGLLTAAAAFKTLTLATAAWELVLEANPIVLLVTLLVGLGAALVVLWKKSQTFRDIVHDAISVVSIIFHDLGHWAHEAWQWLGKVVSIAGAVFGAMGKIGSGFALVRDVIGAAVGKLHEWLTGIDVLKGVNMPWQDFSGGGGGGGGSGGGAGSTPRHTFAAGGSFMPGLALVGEQGPELVRFGRPGQVFTASETRGILSGPGSGGSAHLDASVLAALAAAVEAGAYAGTQRAIVGSQLRFERRGAEVLARIVDAGQTSLRGLS